LLLVAVLVLAASFIVLALVINSAIFTENLATREDVAGSEETLEYRAEVVDGIGETLSNGNEDKDLSTHSGLEDHVETEVATLRTLGGLSQAIRGGAVDLTYQSKTDGDRIAQENSSRALTDRNDTADWTLIDNANSVRNVQFNLTASDTTGDSFIFPSNNPFRLLVEGTGGGTWTMSVANDTVFFGTIDTDEIVIRVERPDGTVAECIRDEPESDDSLRIDVTGGTAGGEPCHALNRRNGRTQMWLGTGVSAPYDISFENGDNINGSYSMITEGGTPNSANLESGHDADEPFVMNALYDVELSYVYQNHAVAYEDRIRVAPGEVPP
jgi:hypothetical protein